MENHDTIENLIPNELLTRVEALAAAEQRTSSDVLREAVEGYLQARGALAATDSEPLTRTAEEAARRILERRKYHPLPEGETIRDLMTYGRA